MNEQQKPATLAEYTSRYYSERVEEVVRRLRRMADEVERQGVEIRSNTFLGTGPHSENARGILHSVMWGLANADLDTLVSAASQADEAIHKGDDA